MRFVAALVCLALTALGFADVYTPKKLRASILLTSLVTIQHPDDASEGKLIVFRAVGGGPGVIPAGVTIEADDLHGKLTIEGPADKVRETIAMIEVLDVAPPRLRISITIACPSARRRSTTKIKLDSGSSGGTIDRELGLVVSISPKLNEDGTVTVLVGAGRDSVTSSSLSRFKLTEGANLMLVVDGDSIQPKRGGDAHLSMKDWEKLVSTNPSNVHIRITAEILPDK